MRTRAWWAVLLVAPMATVSAFVGCGGGGSDGEPGTSAVSRDASAECFVGTRCVDATTSSGDDAASGVTPTGDDDATVRNVQIDGSSAGDDDGSIVADGGTDSSAESGSNDAALAADVDQNCSDYNPVVTTSSTTVRFTNNRASDVYLGKTLPNCSFDIGFTVKGADSGAMYNPAQGYCQPTCGALEHQTSCACFDTCSSSQPVTRLAPGGTYDVGWTGTVFVSAPMPSTCYGDAGCNTGSCLIEEEAPAGTLTIATTAYTMPICDGGACTNCTPGANGNCTVNGSGLVGGTPIAGSATWSRGQSLVSISFH